MPEQQKPKTQPWKAMKSTEEEPNPDFLKMKFDKKAMTGSFGASVTRPMDRDTKYNRQTEESK